MHRGLMVLLLLLLALPAAAQTSTNTAFRFRSGTALPSTCKVGDVYYKTAATAGQYNCTATNTFTLVAGTASPVTGTGTTGTLAKFTGASAIGNSLVTDDGTNVTVGGNLLGGSAALAGGSISANAYLTINPPSESGGGQKNGVFINVTRLGNPGGSDTNAVNATSLYFNAADTASDFYGLQAKAQNFTANQVQRLIGSKGNVGNLGGGTVTVLATPMSVFVSNNGTITETRGVDISGWTGAGTHTASAAIYIDNTIPHSTNAHYAINSLSVAQSYFAGNLSYAGASATHGEMLTMQAASTTVSASNGATTISATNLIPAGAMVYAVVTRVITAFGVGSGLTSLDLGDGTAANLFGNDTGITAGTTTSLADHLSTFTPKLYPAATSVVVTANGGTFTAVGSIRVTVLYYSATAPTS